MTGRINSFAQLKEAPSFEVKAKTDKPVSKEAVDRIADEHGFPSRQARSGPASPKRKPRIYRTGRNRNFSVKATNEVVERFYKMADERKMTLGALLEAALNALEASAAADKAS